MKKTLIFLFVIFFVVAARAEEGPKYKYSCRSLDDYAPYEIERIALEVHSEKELTLKLNAIKQTIATYKKDADYKPTSEKMKAFSRFHVKEYDLNAYGEGPISPLLVENVLLDGGKELRNGKMGGFIKTAGHGYSWANYLCETVE